MTSIFHALNISTLAAWLSVAGLGTVGVVVEQTGENPASPRKLLSDELVAISIEDLGSVEEAASQKAETGDTGEAAETETPLAEQETIPSPPELPELADLAPLPAIPDLPAPSANPVVFSPPPPPQEAPRAASSQPVRSSKPSATHGSVSGKSEAKGKSGNGGSNGGSGQSSTNRLAGGRMTKPSYPSEARKKGQQGTVTVEFIVDPSGRVISAYAKSPCPWPALNESAVSCVRRWKFSPGGVDKYVQPVVFRLN